MAGNAMRPDATPQAACRQLSEVLQLTQAGVRNQLSLPSTDMAQQQ
jgi:hypothetical protein